MYQALYRKLRPQTFDDVIGQRHITESLKNQVMSGRLSHAYIFIGTRGTGKTTCARILARAVNCEHPLNGNPCGECPSCRGIADGSIMDIVELDAASNNGVENVRALRDEAIYSPADVKKRVYIIDEVHMLSTSAFNALLKIIEEPPEHLMFILATTELQKVPATILSRCQRHSFRRIDRAVLADYLLGVSKKENINLAPEAASLIAGLAEGGVRDALSMLDQCSAYGTVGEEQVYSAVGIAGNRRVTELFEDIRRRDSAAALSLFDTLWRDGKDPASLIKEMSGLARDLMVMKAAPGAADGLVYGGYEKTTLESLSSTLSVEELTGALDAMQSALRNMTSGLSPKMSAELCIVELTHGTAPASKNRLEERIAALEKAVAGGASLRQNVPGQTVNPLQPQGAYAPMQPSVPSQFTPPSAQTQYAPPASQPQVQAGYVPAQYTSLVPQPTVQTGYTQPAAQPTSQTGYAQPAAQPQPLPSSAQPVSQPMPGTDYWPAIRDYIRPFLRQDVAVFLNDPARIYGAAEGDSFVIYLSSGMAYVKGNLNRADNIEKVEAATSVVIGKKMQIRIKDMQPGRQYVPGPLPAASSRSDPDRAPDGASDTISGRTGNAGTAGEHGNIEELRKFPEVKFV